jgi:hypothetical protein
MATAASNNERRREEWFIYIVPKNNDVLGIIADLAKMAYRILEEMIVGLSLLSGRKISLSIIRSEPVESA